MTTIRISNIPSVSTVPDLQTFFANKTLALASGQTKISLTRSLDNVQTATVTLADKNVLLKALSLSSSSREMAGKVMDFDTGFDGFTTLADGADVDIVALHGLNGHAFSTWEYADNKTGVADRFMWLRDCLPEHVSNARIMTYGYNANVVNDVSTGRLRTFAETFLEKLRMERGDGGMHYDKPLVFMAHSLGGLVIKQALLVASTRADRRFQNILDSLNGIIFFGTPHRGSNGVKTGVFVTNLLRAVNVDARSDLIRTLDPRSPILFDLTDDFRQVVDKTGVDVYTFFETKKTTIRGRFITKRALIVEEQSAVLGASHEKKASINSNHSYMCKFKGPTDPSYISARGFISELITSTVPIVTTKNINVQPDIPSHLKFTCLKDPANLDSDDKNYPVLIWGEYTYWALSYLDNRMAMAIVAVDRQNQIAGIWEKDGARYICRIKLEKGLVEFIGQAEFSVVLKIQELRLRKK